MPQSLIPSSQAIPVQRFTEWRTNLELNRKEMAIRLGMSRQWLINMENGRFLPKIDTIRRLCDLSLGFLTPNDFFPTRLFGHYETPTNKRCVLDSSINDFKIINNPQWIKHFWQWRKKSEPKKTYQQMADLLGARSPQTIQAWEKGTGLPRSHAMFLKIYKESDGKVTPDAMILNEALDIPPVDWCGEMKEHFINETTNAKSP